MNELRYVVLRHEGIAEPHFDVMFETSHGSPLRTWRSKSWPLHDGTRLEPLGNHRREYLGFEGALSGDRGYVTRVAEGTYEIVKEQRESLTIRLITPTQSQWTITRSAGGDIISEA